MRRTSSMFFFQFRFIFHCNFDVFWYLVNDFYSSLAEPGIFLLFIVIVWIKNLRRTSSMWFFFDMLTTIFLVVWLNRAYFSSLSYCVNQKYAQNFVDIWQLFFFSILVEPIFSSLFFKNMHRTSSMWFFFNFDLFFIDNDFLIVVWLNRAYFSSLSLLCESKICAELRRLEFFFDDFFSIFDNVFLVVWLNRAYFSSLSYCVNQKLKMRRTIVDVIFFRFRFIFHCNFDVFWYLDNDFLVVWLNRAYFSSLSYCVNQKLCEELRRCFFFSISIYFSLHFDFLIFKQRFFQVVCLNRAYFCSLSYCCEAKISTEFHQFEFIFDTELFFISILTSFDT